MKNKIRNKIKTRLNSKDTYRILRTLRNPENPLNPKKIRKKINKEYNLKKSPQAISNHMKRLKEDGLVKSKKEGRKIYYKINYKPFYTIYKETLNEGIEKELDKEYIEDLIDLGRIEEQLNKEKIRKVLETSNPSDEIELFKDSSSIIQTSIEGNKYFFGKPSLEDKELQLRPIDPNQFSFIIHLIIVKKLVKENWFKKMYLNYCENYLDGVENSTIYNMLFKYFNHALDRVASNFDTYIEKEEIPKDEEGFLPHLWAQWKENNMGTEDIKYLGIFLVYLFSASTIISSPDREEIMGSETALRNTVIKYTKENKEKIREFPF